MPEKLTYYTIVPWRKIEETHVWSDNLYVLRWDDDRIFMREENSRVDEPVEFVYHRRQEPLIDKLRGIYECDLKIAQENLQAFNKCYEM